MVEFVSLGWWAFFFRWLHIASGVMWIGHLWYFNFTQTPTMPKIPQELRPGVVRYILPEALFWFRWGAMLTIITGLIVAWLRGIIGPALGLGIGHHDLYTSLIGFGMWLGIIMWFNVWFIIWPNQKKVLGITPAQPAEVDAARRLAGLTSRVNTMLSIPMLYCMASMHYYG
jgi:uncharacterized membrane protein